MRDAAPLVPLRVDIETWQLEGIALHAEERSVFWEEPFYLHALRALLADGRQPTHCDPLWLEFGPPRPPSFVILHSGRAGSTLLSRMLAEASGTCAVREPQPVNRALRHHALLSAAFGDAAPTALMSAFGALGEWHLKASSWNAALSDTFREILPGVPFVAIVRSPAATATSYASDPAGWRTVLELSRQEQEAMLPWLRESRAPLQNVTELVGAMWLATVDGVNRSDATAITYETLVSEDDAFSGAAWHRVLHSIGISTAGESPPEIPGRHAKSGGVVAAPTATPFAEAVVEYVATHGAGVIDALHRRTNDHSVVERYLAYSSR